MFVAQLQWGHVVVDVEGKLADSDGNAGSNALQWGHVVVDVEGWLERRIGGLHRRHVAELLQWGHVVVDVEGPRLMDEGKP